MRTFSEYLADRDIGLLIEYISLHENEPWYKRWGASAIRAAAPFVAAGGLMGGGVRGQDVKPSSPSSSEVKGGLVRAWDASNGKFVMVPFSDTEKDTALGLLVYKPKTKMDSPKLEPKVDNAKVQPKSDSPKAQPDKKVNNDPVEKASITGVDPEKLQWLVTDLKRIYKDRFYYDTEVADAFKDSKEKFSKYAFMKAKNKDSFRNARWEARDIMDMIYNTFNKGAGIDGKTFIQVVDLLKEHMPGLFERSDAVDAALFYYSVEMAGGLLQNLNSRNVSPEEAKIILDKIKPVKDIMLKFPHWSHNISQVDKLVELSNAETPKK